jgi:predicted transcriptional regulator
MNEGNNGDLVQEMQWVRKLLMLQVLASGYQQKDIALLLGVSDATLSRMLPKGISKKSKT